jgi:hypothetical protein
MIYAGSGPMNSLFHSKLSLCLEVYYFHSGRKTKLYLNPDFFFLLWYHVINSDK